MVFHLLEVLPPPRLLLFAYCFLFWLLFLEFLNLLTIHFILIVLFLLLFLWFLVVILVYLLEIFFSFSNLSNICFKLKGGVAFGRPWRCRKRLEKLIINWFSKLNLKTNLFEVATKILRKILENYFLKQKGSLRTKDGFESRFMLWKSC